MRPAPFSLSRPDSLDAAVAAIAAGGTPLAGGQSLLQAMKLRQAAPKQLVDLARLPGLDRIEPLPDGGLRFGALVRHRQVLRDPAIAERLPWLKEAAQSLGDVQVRNRGTLVGNCCWGDSRANLLLALIVSDAAIDVIGPQGSRQLALQGLVDGFRHTVLSGELATAVVVPPQPPGTRGAYLELTRQRQDLALVNLAVVLNGNPVESARIAAGGLAETPLRLTRVEAALIGRHLQEESIAAASAALSAERFDPPPDQHAPAAYRIEMTGILLARALRRLSAEMAA